MIARSSIDFWVDSVVNSYTQIFFSKNRIFGVTLIATTFFDIGLGISGLLAVLISNLIAVLLGFNRGYVKEGSYGFNSLLVGLGLGVFYDQNLAFFVVLAVSVFITVLFTVTISGVLAKYSLPYLSLPFLFGIWTVLLASRGLEALGLSQKGVYYLNELYASGDVLLVNIYFWFNDLNIPNVITTYLRSMGAILFQFNALSGLIITIGLLIHSRIAFSVSLLSFLTAYYFYVFIGANIDALGYSYIGFNFILSGIAIGSFFLIPSKSTYIWTILLVPAIVILTLSLSSLFTIAQLSIYSLPFNIVVIAFLYALKLRCNPDASPVITPIQLYSPEENFYGSSNQVLRYAGIENGSISLPFFGEWFVSQGQIGHYTHKEEWKDAWDFVVVDENGTQYKNNGNCREDYFCYDKPVLAPADGTVQKILNNVEENKIGESNLLQNWGNSVVIKHTELLYSQMSHLKNGSICVDENDEVKKGEVIGHCGNSGRSPYPHLHFQLQSSPFVGSKTIKYPINNYVENGAEEMELHFFDYPKEGSVVKPVETKKLLTSAFHFLPGRKISFKVEDGHSAKDIVWEVRVDAYNNGYVFCEDSNSKAYFKNDGTAHFFTFFNGKRDTLLYYFYLSAYKVLLGYYHGLKVHEEYPLHIVAPPGIRYLHDFTAPLFKYMNAYYTMEYGAIDDVVSPTKIELISRSEIRLFNKKRNEIKFNLSIEDSLFKSFVIELDNKRISASCLDPDWESDSRLDK